MIHPIKSIICLMGPTASGKTALAVEIAQRFPCDIISVDSAMIYRGMDIGTAKPTPDILHIAPHRLIDILDPAQAYSAGQFRIDALREIDDVIQNEKIPLLVGGTMLYFYVLQQGLAPLPTANPAIRFALLSRAEKEGWDALYTDLMQIDPVIAARIHPKDKQRIQRALEVYELTGKPISVLQADTHPLSGYDVHYLAIAPKDRAALHIHIAERFQRMLALGFLDEVKQLYARDDLTAKSPSMRLVGYRQAWAYLAGEYSYEEMLERSMAATRQLAKRQLTWLRSWPRVNWFEGEVESQKENVCQWINNIHSRLL